VDKTVLLVGHPNLTAVGPKEWRHYSWSFNLPATAGKQARDVGDISTSVNPKDVALLARYDHVKAICAKMVERNPVVVRCEAPREPRKQRGGTIMDLKDQSALYDESVAWAEPGRRRLKWSESHVFFPAGTEPRNVCEQRGISVAVNQVDLIGAVWGHEQLILRSGHARWKPRP
jgi:hypothetical protein